MALLEGPPVIAEDLLEGVFVDPLSVMCHGRWLYHTLPLGSTCLPSLPCAPPWSLERGTQGQHKKEILIRSSYLRTTPYFRQTGTRCHLRVGRRLCEHVPPWLAPSGALVGVRQAGLLPRDAGGKPGLVVRTADQEHRARAGIRHRGIQRIVNLKVAIGLQGNACQVRVVERKRGSGFTNQRGEDALPRGRPDAIAPGQQQPPALHLDAPVELHGGLEISDPPDLAGGLDGADNIP